MNLLQTYLQDISKYPQLSPQEELTLAQRARQGNTEAREQLIHAHLPLVVRVAKIYMPPCDEMLDLIQEGNIGLIKAVDMFDPAQGNRLTTLAFYWINKHIQRFLNHEPDDLVSLDMEINDGAAILLLSDTIEDKGTILGGQTIPHIDAVMEHEEMQRQVREMLSRLPKREREVLRLLYGLDNYPVLSRNEVAQIIGVSLQYISRIRIDTLRRLKKMAETIPDGRI
jgi:RNA polymerase sigma factor (sigma-70 family)